MQDAYTFQLEAVDGILVRAFLVYQALHGRQGLECHAVHLYRSPARNLQGVQDLRIARDHRGVRVESIGGGTHDDHVGRFIHRIQARNLRRVGIGHDSDPVTFYPETSMSVPLDLHTPPTFHARELTITLNVRCVARIHTINVGRLFQIWSWYSRYVSWRCLA